MVFCNLLPFAGSQSIRNRLRVGKELPAGAKRAGVGEGSGAVDGCFLPRDQRLLHPPSLAETLPSSAVALVRLVPSGRARTRCGVSGAALGGLRVCVAAPHAAVATCQVLPWCPSPVDGMEVTSSAPRRTWGRCHPLCCQGLVTEVAVPAPLPSLLPFLHRAENNHDKSETLPWPRQGAGSSG